MGVGLDSSVSDNCADHSQLHHRHDLHQRHGERPQALAAHSGCTAKP